MRPRRVSKRRCEEAFPGAIAPPTFFRREPARWERGRWAMPWSTLCADAVGFSRASALAYKDGQSRKYDEASWIRWLARDGRIGVDAAHARRARLRVDRAGVFLDVPGGPDGALRREGERS